MGNLTAIVGAWRQDALDGGWAHEGRNERIDVTGPPDDARLIARARERFLESGDLGADSVRDPILASWRRSQFWDVSVDLRELPYQPDIDTDSRLVHAAQPVLDRLQAVLTDMPFGVILTDAHSRVLDRRTGDPSLNRELDAVWLAPGFSYAEQFVGTNAIGTAVEEKRTAHVFGSEHFSGRLQGLSCAGAPIRNALTGRIEGVIDVTCWCAEANPLMPALVQEAANDIEQRLLELASGGERALLQEFLAASRRANNAVLSINDDFVIANTTAARLLNPTDHVLVRERAIELMGSERPVATDVFLSGGQTAKLRLRPVMSRFGAAGAIVELSIRGQASPTPNAAGITRSSPLPGVAGRSPAWLKACADLEAHCRSRSWLLLTGEAGVGKCAIAEAAHRRWFPTGRLAIIEADDSVDSSWLEHLRPLLLDAAATVVVRRVDRLSAGGRQALAEVLDGQPGEGPAPWLVATSASAELGALLDAFPVAVAVPPLRHHLDDIRDLVPALIERHAPNRSLTCTPEALQGLLRASWPGNVAQLERVLCRILAHRRTGQIGLEDLPPECRATSRRVLT
ncbi:MAG: Fis family transcriptional regulator, partial [Acidimicrobiales bacterium]|nr:Fis family transcriptional regulator [Acidimicrobiales bacterium]